MQLNFMKEKIHPVLGDFWILLYAFGIMQLISCEHLCISHVVVFNSYLEKM